MVASFNFNGTDDAFADFAAAVQGTFDGDVIRIAHAALAGEVRRTRIEDGLSIINWSLHAIEPFEVLNNYAPPAGLRSYLLNYYFEPDNATLSFITGDQQIFPQQLPALLVFAHPCQLHASHPAGTFVRCTSLYFTEEWLLRQVTGLRDRPSIGQDLLHAIESTLYRPLFKGELFFTKELYHEFNGAGNALIIRTHVFNLLAVLYRHIATQARNNERRRDNPIIWQVEKELLQHLSQAPPSIEELARKFYMSPSTLQRHFKSVFGMNAYEYYLRKKMDEAKKLLRGGQSVNMVSYALGYESVSHFIRIFRKIVGENPGRFKKISNV